LKCYKSDRHQECSEQFYKKEVEKVLRSEEVSTESKKELIEMLKRDKIEREKDEIEFEKILNPEKFENLDINPETEELLALLSPEEKALFEACLADNSILAEIQSAQKYWWDENFKIIPDSAPALKSPGPLPVKPHWTTELFVINLIIGYVFVMRRYLCDPQDLVHEFTDELIKVCLCLSDKPEISEDSVVGSAVQAILELADKDVCLQSLTDATIILKNKLKIRHALSHIAEILGTKKLKKEKRRMAKKVDFYHSWLLSEKAENLEFRVVMSKKLLEKEFKSFQNDEKIISEKMKSTVLIEPVTDNPKLIIEVE